MGAQRDQGLKKSRGALARTLPHGQFVVWGEKNVARFFKESGSGGIVRRGKFERPKRKAGGASHR